MPGTRSSARLSGNSPESKGLEELPDVTHGTKRKAGPSSQPSKQQKKDAPKKRQASLSETMSIEYDGEPKSLEVKNRIRGGKKEPDGPGEIDTVDSQSKTQDNKAQTEDKETYKEEPSAAASNDLDSASEDKKNDIVDSTEAIEVSKEREKVMPSNIVEKGVIYFFTRGRVNTEDPESTTDLQRTYFVLRPLPRGAKLSDGPLPDSEHNRLFALPKKSFPKGHSDRFMAFVEKGKTTIQNLKDSFFQGKTYETKTKGTQHTPPVMPIGEGVYAITETGRSSHLVYMLTIPEELGEVQSELGLSSKGSFIMSVKNPERPGPAYSQLPQAPSYPKDIIEEFRGLAWVPVKPSYLNYDNTQILLIGEGKDNSLSGAVEPPKEDQNQKKETPLEELEKLEHEDEIRVDHLAGNDSVYDDLHISKKDYPDLKTTW